MLAGVQGEVDHHCGRGRGPFPGGSCSGLRRVEGLGQQAARPLPRGRRRGVRAAVAAAQDVTHRDPRRDRRVDPRASTITHPPRSRRGTGHDPLASRTPPRDQRVGLDDRPHPDPCRTGHPRTQETATVVLHPVRSRTAQRVLASRLHPLAPRRRHRHRDPDLARRPLPLRPVGHRPPARHRADRARHLPRRDHHPWTARLHTH